MIEKQTSAIGNVPVPSVRYSIVMGSLRPNAETLSRPVQKANISPSVASSLQGSNQSKRRGEMEEK